MEAIYDKVFTDLKKFIDKSSDDDLKAELYRENLRRKFAIAPPYLDTDGLAVEIKSKTLTDNNAPEGYNYTVGDMANYAYYSIPVRGKVELLEHKIKDILEASNKFAIVNSYLFVEEYYFEKIENNEKAIQALKAELLKDLNFIHTFIEQIHKELKVFGNKLITEIDIEISAEIERRNRKSHTLKKLNPYQ